MRLWMARRWLLAVTAAAGLALGGCTAVTFSHEGVIDFAQFPSVYVQPIVISGRGIFDGYSQGLQDDLARELRDRSGFAGVTVQPSGTYVTVLSVELYVDEDYDSDFDEDDTDDRFYVEAAWHLRTLEGDQIDGGSLSVEGDYIDSTTQEAIGEIAHHYLRPYRL